ncbi:hypothetical protein ARMSODRAFT_289208 [Armillaria solidipes]|uniref:Uncharacterized protein n=1 Tax=Armillaria solidipes TaxID=1076256 RepID=A0A2H3C6P7_9AGAR|nr:hypothetical protein ARMSODRAFT_289208 [Armillaria solidipes]
MYPPLTTVSVACRDRFYVRSKGLTGKVLHMNSNWNRPHLYELLFPSYPQVPTLNRLMNSTSIIRYDRIFIPTTRTSVLPRRPQYSSRARAD